MIFLSPSVKCDNNARIDMIRAGGTKTFLLPFYSNNLDNTLIENVSKGDWMIIFLLNIFLILFTINIILVICFA